MIKKKLALSKSQQYLTKNMHKGFFSIVVSIIVVPAHAVIPVDFADLVQQVSPAVVSVNVVKKMSQEELLQQQVPEVLKRFFGNKVIIPQQPSSEEKIGYGSAFFISKDGYLLTNHHVVRDASHITIILNDRSELDAKLIGSDERTDIALLKVDGNNYQALKTGNVNNLRVGEPVLAIGSPFGFDYSASAGIVSAKSRNMLGETSIPFIQTDVALNPGNSGGPLFNQKGEVVGVNSRIFSGTGGYMGLSFSIPIDVATDVADQLRTTGVVSRSYLGVFLQDIDRNLADAYHLPKPEGSLINQITVNSPADKAGLKVGDIILKFNQSAIGRTGDLLSYLNRTRPNQNIQLQILRHGQTQNITVVLTTAPDDAVPVKQKALPESESILGMEIRDLTADEYDKDDGGILVEDVVRGGIASQSKIITDDIIIQVNDTPIYNVKDFKHAIAQLPNNAVARVTIVRQGRQAILGLKLKN